ncbi:hypothetical protein C8F04DRAFT_1133575 [Mycena alexandri]|uniref:G-protein coupled receptors family 2 profile 2 domain-containing protein n=1 Tax=Mycena alexandri TaxID=1745969 RepID=A0AAD6SE89_9AGAR|nr:hypothetical protein C8F04DRAFT_1133575 [Mycena alexandri]
MSETTQPLLNGGQIILRVNYTAWQAHGVTILVVASSLSLIAVFGLLTAIALSAFNTRSTLAHQQHLFLRTHAAAYLISLLICDMIQSVASIMNARWILDMAVETGLLCVMQGAMKQISDVGLSFWTFVIALHTFCLVVLGITPRPYVLWVVLIGGWSGLGILAMTGPAALDTAHRGPFYGISGYWCWITQDYVVERATYMFMAGISSFVLYSVVFLRMRGNIMITGKRVMFSKTCSKKGLGQQLESRTVAYTVVILPIAAARFSDWAGKDVPFEVTIFCDTVFLLSGIVNVTLFTTTRRILPAGSIKLPRFRVDERVISRPQIVTEYDLELGSHSLHRQVSTISSPTLKAYSSINPTERGPAGILAPPTLKEVIPNS